MTLRERHLIAEHRGRGCGVNQIARWLGRNPGLIISNGGTEAIKLIIEKTRRLAHGFRNFTNYRILLAADGSRPWRRRRRGSG